VLIISPAANGGVDLGLASAYYPSDVRLYERDSGSLLVGASRGASREKASFSNYGTPVEFYSWGLGVVTTSVPYGDPHGQPYGWTHVEGGNNPSNTDRNAYFTNNFAGTSASGPIIAGAAALLQSHAKSVFDSSVADSRYLMPNKIKDFLQESGVAQAGGGGNIGVQPDMEVAIRLLDEFWADVLTRYPQLETSVRLTEEQERALRTEGIGLVCRDYLPDQSDPICPDSMLWEPGKKIAKSLDFDGDGRADLVSWTNGQWKIDLSSIGTGATGDDNFGEWDMILNYPATVSKWVWPYVEDYNSDGREDLAVYDKEHGKWYIAFTDFDLLSEGTWQGWDWELDYSSEWVDTLEMDPDESNYSRPIPGFYGGYTDTGKWLDIAIAGSDGNIYVDYGGPNREDYGRFDAVIRYLTDEELAAAPGWAYPVVSAYTRLGSYITYKTPDGGVEEQKVVYCVLEDCDGGVEREIFEGEYGGNDSVLMVNNSNLTLRQGSEWIVSISSDWEHFTSPTPQGIWGGMNHKPIIADFDGNGIDDRAVMGPNEWRIEYQTDRFDKSLDNARYIPLTYSTNKFTLPGRPYAGGISYKMVKQLMEYAQETNPSTPPPIPVDMPSMSICSIPVDDRQGCD